ncbi:hypothetical protein [Alkalitalea saponilacus]|uniref:Uncharacterized protein n=1 Tax=Alkalitalea saponilacus TaxID=889453 RepID=A0A1T5F5Y7_9BACT|nr:hypothetical protein [Alkalitalea saponilacus]ASB50166.1 hypothetical protein CDL62_13960 [Alkalitalea saponilacus]SKB91520.1 hypothetical protein SAMN03080601_01489 [Alkalitalea saponilacus]
MRTNDFRHWWIDFLLSGIVVLFILCVDYGSIIEKPKRDFLGVSVIYLLRIIGVLGGKTFVYGFLSIVASLLFVNGMQKVIRQWRDDEPNKEDKYSPSFLVKDYQTLCDVLLAKGYDDDFISLITDRGTKIWASKVADKLNRLKSSNPDAYKAIEKWAKLFKGYVQNSIDL